MTQMLGSFSGTTGNFFTIFSPENHTSPLFWTPRPHARLRRPSFNALLGVFTRRPKLWKQVGRWRGYWLLKRGFLINLIMVFLSIPNITSYNWVVYSPIYAKQQVALCSLLTLMISLKPYFSIRHTQREVCTV